MNNEDVQLDYYGRRNLNVVQFRSMHTRLALQLLEEGKKEKAIEVLDHCMELAPSRVLPYDEHVSGITIPDGEGGYLHFEGIIEAYYLCGEMDKANTILTEFYRTLAEEHNYYHAMKPRHKSSIQRKLNEVLFQLEALKRLVQQFDQTDVMLELGIIGFDS
jgi:hypothetical protein